MDERVRKAQRLFWEVSLLQQQGARRATLPRLREMALVHESRAIDLLQAGDADGWIDLYAAITAWGECGSRTDAERLVDRGRKLAALFPVGQENIERELDQLERWLDNLSVVPRLQDFDRQLPAVPVLT